METPRGHDRKLLVCIYELIGQILFMYIALVSGGSGSDSWGIAGPLALFVVVNIFGGVSGGHFNPAVTLGVYVREAKWAENFIYTLMILTSQLSGALIGMMLASTVLRVQKDGDWTILPGNVPLLLPNVYSSGDKKLTPDSSDLATDGFEQNWSTFAMEIMCTFVFVLLILHVTGKKTMGPDLGVYGVPAICLNLWALCNVCWFTAPSFNPALAVGQTVFMYWNYPVNP